MWNSYLFILIISLFVKGGGWEIWVGEGYSCKLYIYIYICVN